MHLNIILYNINMLTCSKKTCGTIAGVTICATLREPSPVEPSPDLGVATFGEWDEQMPQTQTNLCGYDLVTENT